MGFYNGLLAGILGIMFLLVLVVPTVVHFVSQAAPAKPIDPGLYLAIARLEVELIGQTQECAGSPYEAGITSLVSPHERNLCVYGYGFGVGHENCRPGYCNSFIDEDGRPW